MALSSRPDAKLSGASLSIQPVCVHIDPYIVLGSAVVGLLVGMTGAGGGALMTPMLILLFGVTPSAAISSDLVAAVVMRPIGAGVHLRAGTVNLRLVGWMVVGSVPAAFLGAYLLHADGQRRRAAARGGGARRALLVGAARWSCAADRPARGKSRARRGARHGPPSAADDRDRHASAASSSA